MNTGNNGSASLYGHTASLMCQLRLRATHIIGLSHPHSFQQAGEVETGGCHLALDDLEALSLQRSLHIRLGVQ
eukprot:scaffold78628_cov18-Tisochrysis_lutea.AAC.2